MAVLSKIRERSLLLILVIGFCLLAFVVGEVILNIQMDKRNFRRKLKSLGILKDIGEIQEAVSHRPARLYTFDQNVYEKKKNAGFNFEL